MLNVNERITRAKIQLQAKTPFFSYLLLNLNFKEEKDIPSMAIDNYNNCYYNPKWVKTLEDREIEMVLTHEVLHLAFQHLVRTKERDRLVWNIATDLCINDILKSNNFSMIKEGLVPYNHEIELNNGKVKITDIDKKSAERIYDELYSKLPKRDKQFIEWVEDNRFDEHRLSDGNMDKNKIKEIKNNAERWKKLLVEAGTYAKQRGNLPNGIERRIGELLNEKVNWKYLLYKYITNELPIDYSYARQSKRSIATGIYMPIMKKENIDIMVAVDTSGSISQKELTEFMSEIIYIAKSFDNLKMKIIVCDCKVQKVYEVENGNIDELLKLKMGGGGGTSHKPIYDKVAKDYPNTKFIINFTDGYTDFPDEESIKTIWVLCKDSVEENDVPFGEVIKL